MILFVGFVVVLVAITYFWEPSGNRGPSRSRMENPFQGRFTQPPQKTSNGTIDKGQLTRCHNCFAFFPATRVVHEIIEGHLLEFCSESCRQNFKAPHA